MQTRENENALTESRNLWQGHVTRTHSNSRIQNSIAYPAQERNEFYEKSELTGQATGERTERSDGGIVSCPEIL
jgi:hypothetical protein